MAAPRFLANVSGKIKEVIASITSTPNSIVATDATGRLDASVMPVGIAAEVVSATATEALSAGDFVNLYLNGGILSVRKADATTNGKPAHGFVLAAVSNAGTATVYTDSQTNTQVSALVIGSDYFLSTTPGQLTTVAPSASGNLVQYIGRASKATEIIFSVVQTIEIA